MTMVIILLCFTRVQRGGSWNIHMYAFKRELPFLIRCDYVNYIRWVPAYLVEMSVLSPEVLIEFQEDNFVVKCSDQRSNQVSPDQNTDWLNATGKKSGGLLGITRIISTLTRLASSYTLRTVIDSQTTMLTLTTNDVDDEYIHNECTKSRMEKDD